MGLGQNGRLETATVEWNAPTTETGGAACTVQEAMLELETYEADAGPKDNAHWYANSVGEGTADSSVVLGHVLQIPSFVATHAVCVAHQRRVATAPMQTHTAILPGSNFSVVLQFL